MLQANIAAEDSRLAELHRLQILDTPPEEPFDRITALAKTVLNVPMCAVSLVDKDRQWYKSWQGRLPQQLPCELTFCGHTIRQPEPLLVPDAAHDARFAALPFVVGEPFVRSYAGVPLRTRNGETIGAFCVLDTKVRHYSPAEIETMKNLAQLVMDNFELRLQVSTDALTGALTRRAFAEEAGRDIARARRNKNELACAVIDLDHFKLINDNHGHRAGDHALQQASAAIKSALRSGDYLARIGGEEFAVLLPETSLADGFDVAERLRGEISAISLKAGAAQFSITASIGLAALRVTDRGIGDLLSRADKALYAAKLAGRNRTRYEPDLEALAG